MALGKNPGTLMNSKIAGSPIKSTVGFGPSPNVASLLVCLSGWWYTYPLKNMSSSVGMMILPN